MDKVKYYEAQLDKELSKYPIVLRLEKVTNVPKAFLFIGGASILTLLVFFNIGGALITNLMGWLFPAFFSFQALETKTKVDDVQWLTYWSVFGFLSTVEFMSPILLYLIPFYYFFKMLLILWLALPQYRGAEKLYNSRLRPAFLRLNATVDNIVNDNINVPSINEAVSSMRASAGAAVEKLEQNAVQAASAASSKANAAYGAAKENVSEAASAISNKAGAIAETVKESTVHAAEVTRETLVNAADTTKETLSNAAGATQETLTNVAGAAKGTLSNAAGATQETLSNAAGATQETLSNAAGATQETLSNAAGATKETLSNAADATQEKLGDAADSAHAVAKDAAISSNKALKEGTEQAKEALDKAGDALDNNVNELEKEDSFQFNEPKSKDD